MVDLREHQYEALRKLHQLDGKGGLFIDRGGGKTRVALLYCALKKCRRVLVVAPFSVMSIWEQENVKVDSYYRMVDLTEFGSIADRAAAIRRFGDGVLLVNYESYWRDPLRAELIKWAPDAIILDEAHRIRHRQAKLSKFAHMLAARGVPVRLALTGTPISHGLQDIWSIFQFLRPGMLGRWVEFESRFIIKGGYGGYEIKGYRNEDVMQRIISENSFQWEGDIPDPPDVPVYIRLSPKVQKLYDKLKKDSIIEIDGALSTHTVLAPLVLTLLLRLQQVTCGFAKDVDGNEIEIGDDKAQAALDIIEDAVENGQRVVLFARFLHDLKKMESLLRDTKIRFQQIDGSKSAKQRKESMAGLDAGDLDVLLVQLGAGSVGIDLAAASVGIFFSVNFSVDEMLQAKGRLSGALRQRHPVTFYHLLAKGTVDERIYAALTKKMDLANRLTDLNYGLHMITGEELTSKMSP